MARDTLTAPAKVSLTTEVVKPDRTQPTPEAIESAAQCVASAIIEDERIWLTIGDTLSAADVVSAVAPRVIDLLADYRLGSKSSSEAYMRSVVLILGHAGKRGLQ
jgi:hypothetical protein